MRFDQMTIEEVMRYADPKTELEKALYAAIENDCIESEGIREELTSLKVSVDTDMCSYDDYSVLETQNDDLQIKVDELKSKIEDLEATE